LAKGFRNVPASDKTLVGWAKELGFSERNLIRRIRDETGMTFRELRRQTRILVAIEKLAEGQSVTNAALDVGFHTPSAFISAFRLVTGKTPRQFVKGD
jgi:AraC-like DNA-binding protein